MSPKAVNYKANSIVYFKGDLNERVFILKAGKAILKYNDIETGQEMQDLIQTGEFFGVKSALGKYPREETALVVSDASMVQFTVPEFEQIALKNTRIIMKMLKVFSNQLRRIHKQVRNLISTGEQANPETGLFNIGQYYSNSKKYAQALYAFQRYLTYYPSGKFAQEAADLVQAAERYAGSQPAEPAPAADLPPEPVSSAESPPVTSAEPHGKEMSDSAKTFYNAVSLFGQQQFEPALEAFKDIVNSGGDKEYGIKALFEIGRCLFSLEKVDACVKHFTTMIQKYPKHPALLDSLFILGNCYEKKGDAPRAEGFYKKVISMSSDDMPVNRRAKKALRNLSGS